MGRGDGQTFLCPTRKNFPGLSVVTFARSKGTKGDGAGRKMKELLRCHTRGVDVTSKAWHWLGTWRGDSEGLARSRDQDGPSRKCFHLSCGGKTSQALPKAVPSVVPSKDLRDGARRGFVVAVQYRGSLLHLPAGSQQHSWDESSGCERLLKFS